MKRVSVFLVCLFLISIFPTHHYRALQESSPINSSNTQSVGQPDILAITHPKQTTCSVNGGCMNELFVGDDVHFSTFITNSGDADIETMSLTVSIYLTDSSQTQGGQAKNAQGNDLVWENLDLMCDDGSVCDFDGTVNPLSPGQFLDNGEYRLQRNNQDIIWTPTVGQYIVEIEFSSGTGFASPVNVDKATVYVKVVDRIEVEVDLNWLDGNGIKLSETVITSSGSEVFSIDVRVGGTGYYELREIKVELIAFGDVDSATIGSTSLPAAEGVYTLTAGTMTTVETFHNATDNNATITASRSVLSTGNTWSQSGEVILSNDLSADATIFAQLINYRVYGAFPECRESSTNTETGSTTTWNNACEVTVQRQFNDLSSSSDEISMTNDSWHDVNITTAGIVQGYRSDGTGDLDSTWMPFSSSQIDVGYSKLFVEVAHRGRWAHNTLDWDVDYSVSKDGVTISQGTIDECVDSTLGYSHKTLGIDPGAPSAMTGTACVAIVLQPGTYEVEFELNLISQSLTDYRLSNNAMTIEFEVLNNLPIINSFELTTEGDIVFGQEDPLVFEVSAFDVDDPLGDGLYFGFSYPGGEIPGCSGTTAEGATTCTVPVLQDFVGNTAMTVVVTDAHNGQVSEEITPFVWNSGVASATSESGIEIDYSLAYNGRSSISIQTFSDRDHSTYEAVSLEGYAGTYSAVAALTYAPSTTYLANDVLSQSISMVVPKDLEATSLWYIDGSGIWALISDESYDWDASNEYYTYSIPSGTPVIPAGIFVLIGGEMMSGPPEAVVSSFAAEAIRGGAVAMSWDITGTYVSSDEIKVSICANQINCGIPFEYTVQDGDRTYTHSGSQTLHGVTYHIEVAVCNSVACSTPGIASVVADKQVDGAVSATNLAVAVQDDQWVITWGITGDTSDVAMWHVCWSKNYFTDGGMPFPCPNGIMGADATTLNIDMPSIQTGQEYFFTAVPVDALGNMKAAASMNSIVDTRILDSDDDGTPDVTDPFPFDPSEWMDSDDDGVGDNSDAFPFDANETSDMDGDGYGDNSDVFPANSDQWVDGDGDGYGDNSSGSKGDAFPQDYTQWNDTDGDGFGDNAAGFQPDACPSIFGNSTVDMMGCVDSDGDGYTNFLDAFPNDPTEYIDSDGDGVGDNSDAFPNDSSETADSDGDGMGDYEQRILEEALAQQAKEQRRLVIGSGLGLIVAVLVIVLWLRGRRDDEQDDDEVDEKYDQFVNQFSKNTANSEASQSHKGPRRPPKGASGEWIDGYECLEYPSDSGNWFYRDPETEQWVDWE